MKRAGLVVVGSVTVVSVVLAAVAQNTDAKLKKGSVVGVVPVGGLTPTEAKTKLRTWWEGAKLEKLTLTIGDKNLPTTYTATQLGVVIDDVASINQVPLEGLVGQVLGNDEEQKFEVKTKTVAFDSAAFKKTISAAYGAPSPAKVRFEKGKIIRTPEKPSFGLDEQQLPDVVTKALLDDLTFEVPLKQQPKKISDETLNQISEVVAEFKTNFSSGNRPRSSNIRLASGKINGAILMPGEKWGFNEYVGRRTSEAGYREAGVYINGRHDTGIGGGICQVSTTLYNAALFANLKIVERTNHSLPVPYVPLGRDATVNYGAQNLVLENNTGNPIAIVSTYEPGRLTFRILGKKDPTLSVKVTQGSIKYWGGSTRREYDPSLAPGTTKVISTGSNKGVGSYRHIYRNGVKEKTEDLGYSAYTGGGTVIMYGPKAPAKPKVTTPATATPPVPPSTAPTTPEA